MKDIVVALLLALGILGGSVCIVSVFAHQECSARDAYSPYGYHYEWPFTCVYVGEK